MFYNNAWFVSVISPASVISSSLIHTYGFVMVLFGQAYDSSPVMTMSFSMYMWSHSCPGFTLIKIYVISVLSWPQPDQYVFCVCSSSNLMYIYIYISFCHTVWPIYMFHFAMVLVWSIWVFLAPVWASVRSNTCSFLILCHQLTYALSLLLCFQFDQLYMRSVYTFMLPTRSGYSFWPLLCYPWDIYVLFLASAVIPSWLYACLCYSNNQSMCFCCSGLSLIKTYMLWSLSYALAWYIHLWSYSCHNPCYYGMPIWAAFKVYAF